MTTSETPSPAPDPVETVEVIQADFEDAVSICTALREAGVKIDCIPGQAVHVLQGWLARHRQAALTQPAVKTAEQLLEEACVTEPAEIDLLNDPPLLVTASAALKAIRTALSSPCIRDGVLEALIELEAANDHLCGLRTREQYLSMIDDGQQDALERLDTARRNARAMIKASLQSSEKGE